LEILYKQSHGYLTKTSFKSSIKFHWTTVCFNLYLSYTFNLFISSEERTKTLQYILYQREQIDQLLIEKQSVNFFFFFCSSIKLSILIV
jgi:uncharacterized protein YybS (DUF2232 family)